MTKELHGLADAALHCNIKTSFAEPEPEPHHFGGAGAGSGAAKRCGSGSKLNVQHRWIIKNGTNCISFLLVTFTFLTISIRQKSKEKVAPTLRLTFVGFQKVGWNIVG
jgi:hypothetical protein